MGVKLNSNIKTGFLKYYDENSIIVFQEKKEGKFIILPQDEYNIMVKPYVIPKILIPFIESDDVSFCEMGIGYLLDEKQAVRVIKNQLKNKYHFENILGIYALLGDFKVETIQLSLKNRK